MPTLILNTNLKLDDTKRDELAAALSSFTSSATGKSEQWVMTLIHDACRMSFAGTPAPCAFVEFKSIGLPEDEIPTIAKGLCTLLHDRLGLEPTRVYIEFTSARRQYWSWNGSTF